MSTHDFDPCCSYDLTEAEWDEVEAHRRKLAEERSAGSALRTIAAIGARPDKLARIPEAHVALFKRVIADAARRGYQVRTGAAPGCDQVAAEAALGCGGSVELVLPWSGFERPWVERVSAEYPGRVSVTVFDAGQHPQWAAWVDEHHPNPGALSAAARKLMARNGGIIAGAVGVVALPLREAGRAGGTGYGIDLARSLGIRVWDLSEEAARNYWAKKA